MTDLARYEDLQRLHTFPLPVLASPDLSEAADRFAARYERAYRLLSATLAVAPQVGLLVLSAQDWARYGALPTFGVTHYDYQHRMVITAAQPGAFWQPAVDVVGAASASLLEELRAVYGQPDGRIDLTPHIDLWIVHDLGHAFHLHASYWFPRRWLMEYFADLCARAYIVVNEPDQLPAHETFPRVIRALDARHFRYQTWQDFEAHYGDGGMALENYLWYHGYLYDAAKQACDAEGVQALRRMWEAFVVANVQEMDDDKLTEVLWHVQPALAQMLAAWPK